MEWLFLCLVGAVVVVLYWAHRHRRRRLPNAVNDASIPSTAAMRGLMQRADMLREGYARALETKDAGIVRPESHLPASKEEIKAALLLGALSAVSKANRQPDAAALHHYQVSYGFLAYFVTAESLAKRPEKREVDSSHADSTGREVDICAVAISPVEFLNLCEEFAQRFDALTDRERGQAESHRIRAALLGT